MGSKILNESRFSILCRGFLAIFSLLIFFSIIFCSYSCLKKSSYVHTKNVIIERGRAGYICKLLYANNISKNLFISKMLIRILQFCGYAPKIGEYCLVNNISLFDALMVFSSGKSVVHKFTIPEGFSVVQVMKKLNNDKFLLGRIEKIPEEGSLMPDTYFFSYPMTKQRIISMAHSEMQKFLKKAWKNRADNCVIICPQDAVILASIVEKETTHEKRKVAGVYINRLKKNMRLQSDPAVIYAITGGAVLKRKLTRADLWLQHPYNTYRNHGLPPTPICNPSRESIFAVLNPDKTDALFFVHGNSQYGLFAKTFKEHIENIKTVKALSKENITKN